MMITRYLSSRATAVAVVFLAVSAIAAPVQQVQADTRVAIDFFYDELAPQGRWVHHPYYGTVWYPHHQPANWAPYVYGHWVWTADYGWYWESDEDWAWVTYHYGRWVYTDAYGWVWVPDDEWGPAWVEWRTGGGYVGWAPMPPEVSWQGEAFVYAGADMSSPRYQPHWVFVAEARFAKSDPWRYRAPPNRNRALLSATVRATDYRVVDARIVNRSVDVGRISAAAKVRIKAVAVVNANSSVEARSRAHARGRIAVYRPRIRAGAKVRAHVPPTSARVRTEIDTTLPADIEGDVTGAIDTRDSIDTSADVGARSSIDTGIGADIGIGRGSGIGIGGGGGLRIGR